jgi:uncharacterized protein YunC (DUF1805 family)
MNTREINIDGKIVTGFEIPLQNATFVVVRAKNGFVMCGYMNLETAEKLGDAACVVRGVKTVDDLLNAKVVAVTKKAESFGIKIGITGKEALEKLS